MDTRHLLRLVLGFLIGCDCVPPEGPNHRDQFADRFQNVLDVAREAGYDLEAPTDCLYVQFVEAPKFKCGDIVTDGCYGAVWPECPSIRLSVEVLDKSAPEHEYLHYLLDVNGIESHRHNEDFADFGKIEKRAWHRWKDGK